MATVWVYTVAKGVSEPGDLPEEGARGRIADAELTAGGRRDLKNRG